MTQQSFLTGIVVDDEVEFTLVELSLACNRPAEWVLELVQEGILEPIEKDQGHWRFRGTCFRRARIVQHLQSDLGVNLAGAALALDLLEEVAELRRR